MNPMIDIKLAAIFATTSKAVEMLSQSMPDAVPVWFREWGSTGLLFAAIIMLLKDRAALLQELAKSRKAYEKLLMRLARKAGVEFDFNEDDEEK